MKFSLRAGAAEFDRLAQNPGFWARDHAVGGCRSAADYFASGWPPTMLAALPGAQRPPDGVVFLSFFAVGIGHGAEKRLK